MRFAIHSIDPHLPFLRTLAETLVDGSLFAGFEPRHNPMLLSRATIYLPTRRAARALASEFMALFERDAVILPRILTIGDADETLDGSTNLPDLPEAISDVERQLQLARLVAHWAERLSLGARALFNDENLVFPTSTADAIWFAKLLASLIDQVETAEVEADKILALDPREQAEWWQLTTPFLQILLQHWPQFLADNQLVDPSRIRRLIIDRRTAELKTRMAHGRGDDPVIAAGSTGSIAATARFLIAVSQLPRGAVILPGLDFNMEDQAFAALTDPHGQSRLATMPGHPQYGLAQLIRQLGVTRKDVHRLCPQDRTMIGDDQALARRSQVLSLAMLPSQFCELWSAERTRMTDDPQIARALSGVSLIEARTERQEAIAIALVLREVLESPGKTGALVTPNRDLARRVSLEMRRFGIDIDDSGGESLANTLAGRFVRLMTACLDCQIKAEPDPATLTALIKHKLMRCGRDAEMADRLSRLMELVLFRGRIFVPSIGKFHEFAQIAFAESSDDAHLALPLRAMNADDWQAVFDFAQNIDAIAEPVIAMLDEATPLDPAAFGARLRDALLSLSADENGEAHLFDDEAGRVLSQWFDQLILPRTPLQPIPARDLASSIDALLGGVEVRPPGSSHPRLHILGPLEARLQQPDLIMLGGLNEGAWPKKGESDPFLNRQMKQELGIDPPERRVGLAAHDFQQFMATAEVVLSRSTRIDNTPSIASRWLQRLLTVIGEHEAENLRQRGLKWLDMGERAERVDLDGGDGTSNLVQPPAKRPCPVPPLAVRPTILAVTDIETWIRDPYAIYAKKILRLRPLPPLVREPDYLLRGTIFHAALARFQRQRHRWLGRVMDNDNEEIARISAFLMDELDNELLENRIDGEAALVWRHRLAEVAPLVAKWELERAEEIDQVFVETEGRIELADTGFTLTARADRIERLTTGELVLYDYKTGTNPSLKLAQSLSPQLTLEGAIAGRGGFIEAGGGTVKRIAFIRLVSDTVLKVQEPDKNRTDELIEIAHDRLVRHVRDYQQPSQGYLSRFAPHKQADLTGDYDHLARVAEWSIDDGDDDEAEN